MVREWELRHHMGESRSRGRGGARLSRFPLDNDNASRYYAHEMIRSFRDPETERLFRREGSRRLPPSLQRTALRKLAMLDAAASLRDLRVPPGNRLERLKGNRRGQHSIRINDQWRLCFVWRDGDAHEVEIADYH